MEQPDILPARPGEGRRLTRSHILDRLARAQGPGRRGAPQGGDGAPPRQGARGDHDLNPDLLPVDPLTPAAVLVPLVERPEGMTVLLTRRTEHLTNHAGQISFPGGAIDPGDSGPVAAALREAEEEVGIPTDRIEPVGALDVYLTRTGFEIHPIVAFLHAPFPVNPDSFEVAEVFEVPLDFLMDPANHRRESRLFQGVERHFFALPWARHYIWGATAGMLVNLAELLAPEPFVHAASAVAQRRG